MRKKLVIIATLVSLVLSNFSSIPAEAGTRAPMAQSSAYTELIDSDYYAYCVSPQTNNTLPLNATVSINDASMSSIYGDNVFRLPVLKADYYYSIVHPQSPTTYDAEIVGSIYPMIQFLGDYSTQKTIELRVNSITGTYVTVTLNVTLTDSVMTPATEVSTMLDSTSMNCYNINLGYYNEALCRDAIVTSSYIYLNADQNGEYVVNSNYYVLDGELYFVDDDTKVPTSTYNYIQYSPENYFSEGNPITFREYLKGSASDRAFVVAKRTESYVESNALSNTINTGNTYLGNGEVSDIKIFNSNTVTEISAPTTPCTSLDKTVVDLTVSVNTVELLKEVDLESLTGYPVNYLVPLSVSDNTTYTHSSTLYNGVPVVSDGIVTFAQNTVSGVAVLSFVGDYFETTAILKTKDNSTYTVNFNTNSGTACAQQVLPITDKITLPTTTRTGYTFGGWYTDASLTNPVDVNNFSVIANGVYTLYAKWTVNPAGTYTVVWYSFNETNNASSLIKETTTFDVGTLPTNPANPANSKGKVFKTWAVLPAGTPVSIEAIKGATEYSGLWVPTASTNYLFVPKYSMTGVITSVVNTNATAYTNITFNKNNLQVKGILSDSYDVVDIPTTDWTMTPSKWTTPGTKSATITLKSTGATYPVSVLITQDVLQSITAKYKGSSLVVGSTIDKSKIEVIGTYLSERKATFTDININPTTVRFVGSNAITVTSNGKSATINITGTKPESATTGTLDVTYVGTTKKVGDTLTTSDFNVLKTVDGSSTRLTTFGISPTKLTQSGSIKITITSGTLSKSVFVPVVTVTSKDTSTTNPTSTPVATTAPKTTTQPVDAKKASIGYLSGRTILNTALDSTAGVNDIDLLAITKAASKTADVLKTQMFNNFENTMINQETVDSLKKKGLAMELTLLDSTTDKVVGIWKLNGKEMSASTYNIDCAISITSLNKVNDLSYGISFKGANYPTGTEFKLNVAEQFEPGNVLSIYGTSENFTDSRFLTKVTVPEDGLVQLPIQGVQYLVLTNNTVTYTDGSDMREELVPTISENTVEEPTETVSVNELPQQTEEPQVVTPVKDTSNGKALVVVIILVLLVVGALAGIFVINRKKFVNTRK